MSHSKQACGCEWAHPGSIGVAFRIAVPDEPFPPGWDLHNGAGGMMWKPCETHKREYDAKNEAE